MQLIQDTGRPDPVTTARWPSRLWIVRHGESAGNIARDEAMAAGADRIMVSRRDVDIPLSPRGEDQARALGAAFAGRPGSERPDILLVSPYVRAQETARLFRDGGGADGEVRSRIDERLREKEFGILDGLTANGVRSLYPEQAELRRLLGKFYHRPPGGESWCDVVFRLRSVMETIALHHAGERVMILAHQVVVLCLRYVIENLTEEQILAIDRQADVANTSVTQYRCDEATGHLALIDYNDARHLDQHSVPASAEPDRAAGVRG